MRNWANLDIVFRKSLDAASERLYDIERGHKEVASDFPLGEVWCFLCAVPNLREDSGEIEWIRLIKI